MLFDLLTQNPIDNVQEKVSQLLWTGLCQKKLLNAHDKFVVAVSMSPKCKLLASGSNDFTIKVWDCS